MNDEKALNPAWTGQIAQALRTDPTHMLSDQASARIKQSLLQKITASSQAQGGVRNVRRDEGWHDLGKHKQAKVLHDDGTTLSWLLKMLPGSNLPVHDHSDGAEECMILEGSLRINGEMLLAGDYQIALHGSVHYEVFSVEGTLVYLRSPSSRRKDLMGA